MKRLILILMIWGRESGKRERKEREIEFFRGWGNNFGGWVVWV